MNAVIVILYVVISNGPNAEPERHQVQMNSIEACWKTAEDFSKNLPPDMLNRGVSVGCFQKTAGEPS